MMEVFVWVGPNCDVDALNRYVGVGGGADRHRPQLVLPALRLPGAGRKRRMRAVLPTISSLAFCTVPVVGVSS